MWIISQQHLKMESFYKQWLEKNKKENEETRNTLKTNDLHMPVQQRSQQQSVTSIPINNEHENILQNDLRNKIIYENNRLQLYLEKGNHVHQTRFRLQDHLFYLKVKLKDSSAAPPLLRDILDFLQEAFNFILREIKKHYKPEDHNVAYLTLYQQPMICGLNTGENLFFFEFMTFNTDNVGQLYSIL
jgi:hypothetical protein